MSKYTFENWWEGDVYLITCPIAYESKPIPLVCISTTGVVTLKDEKKSNHFFCKCASFKLGQNANSKKNKKELNFLVCQSETGEVSLKTHPLTGDVVSKSLVCKSPKSKKCLKSYLLNDDSKSAPTKCTWEDFNTIDDIAKIKKKQKEIWKEKCEFLFEKHKSEFLNNYDKSAFKLTLLDNRINHIKSLLLLSSEYFQNLGDRTIFNFNTEFYAFFEQDYFDEFRSFIKKYIIEGIENEFDFIHSPNFQFQYVYKNTENLPQVYAQSLSIFLEWLISIRSKEFKNNVFSELPKNKKLNPAFGLIENKFDNTNIEEVINYFISDFVENGLLDEQELISYLTYAFEKQTIPKELFKFKKSLKKVFSKGYIKAIYHNFSETIAIKSNRSKKDIASLLGNYFEGFNTENVYINWARTKYNRKKF